MEGFKQQKKIACFKEGGQVKYESRKEHKEEEKADVAQDKAMIKKGVAQHESKLHKGEPKTELKLKTGGRAKKEKGTVRKYCGGKSVKKMAGGGGVDDILSKYKSAVKEGRDLDPGMEAKPQKTIKTPLGEIDAEKYDQGIYVKPNQRDFSETAVGKAVGAKPGQPWPKGLKKGGKSVKKMNEGGLTEKIMGTEKQNEAAKKTLDKVAKQDTMVGALERGAQKTANFLKGQGAVTDAERAMAESAAVKKKRGGKC